MDDKEEKVEEPVEEVVKEKGKVKGLFVVELSPKKYEVTTPDGVYMLENLPRTWVTLLPDKYEAMIRDMDR